MTGIVTGYALSLVMGVVDFTPVHEAAWLGIPNFTAPKLSLGGYFIHDSCGHCACGCSISEIWWRLVR